MTIDVYEFAARETAGGVVVPTGAPALDVGFMQVFVVFLEVGVVRMWSGLYLLIPGRTRVFNVSVS